MFKLHRWLARKKSITSNSHYEITRTIRSYWFYPLLLISKVFPMMVKPYSEAYVLVDPVLESFLGTGQPVPRRLPG